MIHPEYIIAYFDCKKAKFRIINRGLNLDFEICFYSEEIKVLYSIKKRFKSGKIIKLKINLYVLKINKQLMPILEFFHKNKFKTLNSNINFYRFSYLYQKLVIHKDKIKTSKEICKIKKRLIFFGVNNEQIYTRLF